MMSCLKVSRSSLLILCMGLSVFGCGLNRKSSTPPQQGPSEAEIKAHSEQIKAQALATMNPSSVFDQISFVCDQFADGKKTATSVFREDQGSFEVGQIQIQARWDNQARSFKMMFSQSEKPSVVMSLTEAQSGDRVTALLVTEKTAVNCLLIKAKAQALSREGQPILKAAKSALSCQYDGVTESKPYDNMVTSLIVVAKGKKEGKALSVTAMKNTPDSYVQMDLVDIGSRQPVVSFRVQGLDSTRVMSLQSEELRSTCWSDQR